MRPPRRIIVVTAAVAASLVPVGVTAPGSFAAGAGWPAGASAAGPAAAAATALVTPKPFGFQAVGPARLLDTRTSGGLIGKGGIRNVQVLGRGGVPTSGVGAVALNVTATTPSTTSWLKVWPQGASAPSTSTVNFTRGRTVANSVVVGLGSTGGVSVSNYDGTVNALLDITGWFPQGSGVTPLPPLRVFDTRATHTPLGSGAYRNIKLTGVADVPSDALAVAVTATVANPTANSFLTIYPAGVTRPGTSSLNMQRGRTVANSLIANLGAGGQVTVYNAAGSTEVILDVTGYLSPRSGYVPITPVRVADTRSAEHWLDGGYGFAYPAGGSRSVGFNITKPRQGTMPTVPFGAGSAVLNVTVTRSSVGGWLTVWPDGAPLPPTSTVNYGANETVANGTIIGSPADRIQARTGPRGETDVIVDVSGYFPTDGVGLLRVVPTFRRYALGTEKFGVVFCSEAGLAAMPKATILANLRSQVAPFYEWLSGGRYAQTFEEAATYTAKDDTECLDQAFAGVPASRGYSAVLVVRNTPDYPGGYGHAGPGVERPSAPTYPANYRDGLVSSTSVLAYGGSFGNVISVVDHEIGHMLDWPHSYVQNADPYSNVMDLMSGGHSDNSPDAYGQPDATLAVNRLRSGWIDATDVAVHRTSGTTYRISPIGVAGTQLVAIPSGTVGRFTTLDVRARTGYDRFLDAEGVEVHVVQQAGSDSGIRSRIAPARGEALGTDHVLGAGASLKLGGVTVTVGQRAADGSYPVTVTGTTYVPPVLSSESAQSLAPTKPAPQVDADPVLDRTQLLGP